MSDAVSEHCDYDWRMDAPVDNQQKQSDASLMLAYAAGDASSFDTIYYRHKDKLYRFMSRQLGADPMVDELFQDVWSRVIRARADYRESAAFSTWLYSVARNRIVDHFRSQGRQRELITAAEDLDEFSANQQNDPQRVAVNQQLAQRLKELIGDLPPPQREAFLLKEEAGLSLQEIANVAGVDKETIKSRLRYAVNKLRRQLIRNMADQTHNSDQDISDAYAEMNRQAPLHAPASLDAVILAEAHRAVEAKPKPVQPFIYRWAPPLAMAATVVLTATLVIFVPSNDEQSSSDNMLSSENEAISEIAEVKKEARVQSTAAVAKQSDSIASFDSAAPRSLAESLASDVLTQQAAGIQQRKQSSTTMAIESAESIVQLEEGIEEKNKPEEDTFKSAQTDQPVIPAKKDRHRDAKSWQEVIEKLLEKSNWTEADKEFAAFKLAYPQHEFVEVYQRKREIQ